MKCNALLTVLLLGTMAGGTPTSAAKEPTMPQDNQKYEWQLSDIYPSKAAWRKAKQDLEERLPELARCQGHLAEGAARLAGCLDALFDFSKELRRVSSYASMLSDSDTRNAGALEMRQSVGLLATRFSQTTSFVKPEVLAIDEDQLESFFKAKPKLEVYRHFLEDIVREKPHTLDARGEGLIATAGLMADAPSTVYSILANAEIPWPTLTLSDGAKVRLDQAAYSRYRAVPNRKDRKRVFDAFFTTWRAYEKTCGVTLYSQMKRDLFYAQARHYPSALASALSDDNIPEAVYTTLIRMTNENLGTLHRYLKLRGHMLGITDLKYYDIYPPLVKEDVQFPIQEGERQVLEAIAPLGPKYVATVRKGFANQWMDVYPRTGKRSGAYSSGSVYDVHPFVLLNYNNDYESVSTLAHEWGHAMHSYLANAAQPYPTADYSIFVAEVASTFNEALLLDHMLKTAKDDNERLYYLGSALEGLRGTFFRQAMFAEFELEIHRLVEQGEALTGERLSKLYGELLRRYHGQDRGVLEVDDLYTVEWAFIPHFYYDFYVYQYATSIAAASLFAEEVLNGEPGARDRYLAVLAAGSSEYPYEALKNAGVDLASPRPYLALIARMNGIMDRIEEILDRK